MRFDDRQAQCRRAVLAVTDNVGIPGRSETSVIDTLREADALLSGLIVSNRLANLSLLGLLSPLGAKRPGGIEGIVEKTGGDVIYSDDLTTSFPEMIHRLRSRYSLYYRIPEQQAGPKRTVRVELSAEAKARFPGTHVRAPAGYRVHDASKPAGFSTR